MKKYISYIGTESCFQETAITLYRVMGIPCHHSANEFPVTWLKDKTCYHKLLTKRLREGVSKGFPDISGHKPSGRFHGIYTELKVRNKKPSKEQIEWLKKLNNQGYYAFWTNSLDELQTTLETYLNDPSRLSITKDFKPETLN